MDEDDRDTSSTYWIEVCQGPDCTGLGGGAAILEIEELVREQYYQQQQQEDALSGIDRSTNSHSHIRVVGGGCRDFCSVGPNVHIVERKMRNTGTRKTAFVLESFSNVKDTAGCENVMNYCIRFAPKTSHGPSNRKNHTEDIFRSVSSDSSSVRSMMARRADRTRWEALKDVSRTLAKCRATVATGTAAASSTDHLDDSKLARQKQSYKECCRDRIARVVIGGSHPSPRDERRAEQLIEIVSEKLDRIFTEKEEKIDDSSSTSNSSMDERFE